MILIFKIYRRTKIRFKSRLDQVDPKFTIIVEEAGELTIFFK
jgi:hypothetical protein